MENIPDLIANLGFPVFVALFLLIRIEPTLKKLHLILVEIKIVLKENAKHCDEHVPKPPEAQS